MKRKENFTAYEVLPEDLYIYMSHYGPHFTKELCEFAVKQMFVDNTEDNKKQNIKPYTKEQVDNILNTYSVKVKYSKLYDSVYVANMCKFDYLNDSVPNEQYLAKYIKNTLDDPDGAEGLVFNRWIADMKWLGIPIDWSEFV